MKPAADVIYIFLHIPKSAGTTFRYHIEQNFAAEQILGLYRGDGPKVSRDDVFAKISALSSQQRGALRIVYGHEVHYGIHELFDKPSRYITFLRDPVEKTISFYNYRMQQGIRNNQIDETRLPSFEAWLENSPGMHDGMLGDLIKYGFAPNRDVSDAALADLFRKFYFVGTTEDFDQDALFLYYEMGIRRFFRDQNKSQRFLSQEEVERVKALIAEKTPLDRKLYDYAVSWNRAFRSSHPEFAGIVRKMRLRRSITGYVQRLLPV